MTLPSTDNLLLKTLPLHVLRQAGVQEQQRPLGDVLLEADETPAYVFFPRWGAVCSIVRTTTGGQMVEAGVVSGEGMANVSTVLAPPAPTGSRGIVQHAGRFARLEIATVRALFESEPPFREAVLAYTSVFLDHVMQNVLCNRLHTVEQRLAKWLLVMRDRAQTDELQLTHEFLSYMLGVHRPGVSIAVGTLQSEGLIRHRRRRIELRDLGGIAARSCECYRPLREKLVTFAAAHV